jgi:hypothetical protein
MRLKKHAEDFNNQQNQNLDQIINQILEDIKIGCQLMSIESNQKQLQSFVEQDTNKDGVIDEREEISDSETLISFKLVYEINNELNPIKDDFNALEEKDHDYVVEHVKEKLQNEETNQDVKEFLQSQLLNILPEETHDQIEDFSIHFSEITYDIDGNEFVLDVEAKKM